MKKYVSIFLTVLMVFAMLLQVNVYAAGDNELQDAVKSVKSKFAIPANLTEFDYRNGTEGDKKIWTLDWSSKEGNERLDVSVDEKGNIIRYYYDKPVTVSYKKKLPKISKQDARTKAGDFIKKINPELPSQIKYVENNQYQAMDSIYDLNFIRMVNGVQFPENYITVQVNAETGEVRSYNCNWTDGLNFPAKDKVISLEKAETAFKEKLGLKLCYSYKLEEKKVKTFAVYSSVYTGSFIDAITGDKVTIDYSLSPIFGYNESAAYSMKANMDIGGKGSSEVSLTPDEINAIEEVAKLISKEDMEKKLRGLKVLGLSDDFSVSGASLERDWADKETLVWRFNFMKDSNDSNTAKRIGTEYISASADAKTGELRDFWINGNSNGGETPKYDEKDAKAAVEEFLKEIQPDKFKETVYVEVPEQQKIPVGSGNEENPLEYSFNYVRMVNRIEFPSNSLTAGYDAVNGRITSYGMNWFNTTFDPLDKVIPLDEIYKSLFREIGLELQYKSSYPDVYALKFGTSAGSKKPEVKLVYTLNDQKPAMFDANTGIIITSDGEPFKETKPAEYTDIKGHFAEKQIKVLSEYGISFEGTEFNPDKSILQKDFAKILCNILNLYYEPRPLSSGDNSQIDEMYNALIREGIFKVSEKAPDSIVTREDSVKFLIRTLKYDKVADLKGIFNCNFKDKNEINPDLVGYIVIADGLGIIKGHGGYFNPKKALTRAEAMIEAYNYLQI